MFPWGQKAKQVRARVDTDASTLLERETDPYLAASVRERAAVGSDEALRWSRVAVEVARQQGRIGLGTATQMSMEPSAVDDAPVIPETEPAEPAALTLVIRRLDGATLRVYKLQFLRSSANGLVPVEERDVRAPDAGAAIEKTAWETWPGKSTFMRLVDLDGTVLVEHGQR